MDSQLLLDGMLPPFKKFDRMIESDVLTKKEKNTLYQMVDDCIRLGGKYDVQSALASIAKTYGNRFSKGSVLPFTLRQVIFCLAVHCCKYKKMTQGGVISYMNNNGVSISHNFFSRIGYTPIRYLAMYDHDACDSVVNYSGKKKGELGIAIRNLVYQAGAYNTFCDVFGGSGAASLAINKVSGAEYVYNELNKSVFNLISVVADDALYLDLIAALKVLQNYLVNGGEQYGTVNLDNELGMFLAKLQKKKPRGEREEKSLAKDKTIIDTSFQDFEIGGFEAVLATYAVYMDILSKPADFSVKLDSGKYNRESLLDLFGVPVGASESMIFGSMSDAFIRHHSLLDDYMRTVMDEAGMEWSSETGQVATGSELTQEYKQGRAYSYYAYFFRLLEDSSTISSDRIGHALAEIFRRYFSLNGILSEPSSVLSVLRADKKPTIDGFCRKDFETLITDMHKALKGTVLENEDFHIILKKYNENQNVLYYVDPPYVATKGYEDEGNSVGLFTEDDMKDLISGLVESGHKFIYSCRAVFCPSNVSDGKKVTEADMDIFRQVYAVFSKYIAEDQVEDFYVLALENSAGYTINENGVEWKAGTLEHAVHASWPMEIMITNFEICSFIDAKSQINKKYAKYKNMVYKVYPFTEFLKMLMIKYK